MRLRVLLALLPVLLAACAGPAPQAAAPASAQAYVFAYFTKNGEDGLHLAASGDGYRWEKLGGGASYLKPTVGISKLMRDPCIVRGPDGTFHMVWTAGWNEGGIGYASSKDLVHWSAQRYLPVMAHEPGTLNAWAPEIAWDARHGEFVIFWSSTVPGKFPATDGSSEDKYNHRIYATTTRDFTAFTPTRLFYDPGFSVIDATFLRANGRDYLLVKDETRHPPRKYLQLAAADSIEGPFSKLGAPLTPPGLWTEGPTALQVGQDTIIYYDAYTSKHYGALRSRDLVNWEDVTAQMHFPDEGTAQRMRHGTAIAVPAALVDSLRAAPIQAAEPFDVAVTVDDLPFHGQLPSGTSRLAIAQSYLGTLKAHGVPEAFGFVNAAKLEQDPDGAAVLDAWRKAGYPLGNHTFSHMNLQRAPSLDAWQADVIAGEPAVAARMQDADWHWLRFPNLSLGGERAAPAQAFLRGRGYRVADVSLSHGDWNYTDAYARCVAKGDQASVDAMKRQYFRQVERDIAQMKENSMRVFGRVIPQVLLTHLGGWSAATLPDVMARLDAAGARYVTLAQAQSDPAYAQAGGGSLVARVAKQKGIQLAGDLAGEAALDVNALCR